MQAELNDDILGSLRLDSRIRRYEGLLHLGAEPVQLALDVDSAGSVHGAQVRARTCVPRLEQWDQAAKRYAAAELLALANEWADSAEEGKVEPLAIDEFVERLTLQELSLAAEGAVTFCYEDGDLFWGHTILVEMDSMNVFVKASI